MLHTAILQRMFFRPRYEIMCNTIQVVKGENLFRIPLSRVEVKTVSDKVVRQLREGTFLSSKLAQDDEVI